MLSFKHASNRFIFLPAHAPDTSSGPLTENLKQRIIGDLTRLIVQLWVQCRIQDPLGLKDSGKVSQHKTAVG